jgi:hypothetical protein
MEDRKVPKPALPSRPAPTNSELPPSPIIVMLLLSREQRDTIAGIA